MGRRTVGAGAGAGAGHCNARLIRSSSFSRRRFRITRHALQQTSRATAMAAAMLPTMVARFDSALVVLSPAFEVAAGLPVEGISR